MSDGFSEELGLGHDAMPSEAANFINLSLGHDAMPSEAANFINISLFSIENLIALIFFVEFLALLTVVLLPHRFAFESLLRVGLLTIVLAWLQTGIYSVYYGLKKESIIKF